MIEAQPGLDSRRQELVDQAIVKREAGLVGRSAPLRQHARPGHRESVSLHAQGLHQANIFAIAMIMVARDIAGVAILDGTALAVDVPDAQSAAVLPRRSLDLEARGGNAPDEIRAQARGVWQLRCRHERPAWFSPQ